MSMVIDKLTHGLNSLLPQFVKDESPEFVAFIKAYFEYLEFERIELSTQSDIDGILLEQGTGSGSVLLEPGTVSPSPDQDNSKIVYESTVTNTNERADPFKVGEYVVGKTNKSVAQIKVINGNILYVKTIHGLGFEKNEIIEGRETQQTGTIAKYRENSIRANNQLLNYSDIDKTSVGFLQYYQNDFMPQINSDIQADKRLAVKHIKELYEKKGTTASLEFLFRILYGEDAEVYYPIDNTLHLSESSYIEQSRMVILSDTLPVRGDRVREYQNGDTNSKILAEAVVENVYYDGISADYKLDITLEHVGSFTQGATIHLTNRDTSITTTGTVVGIVSGLSYDLSSTKIALNNHYISDEINLVDDNPGDLLLEDGSSLITETTSTGSLYAINDTINFDAPKLDEGNITVAKTVVDSIETGGVTKIFIEEAGTGYTPGDLVIFEDVGTGGSGALGIIGSVGDEIILESGATDGHFQYTISAEDDGTFSVGGLDDFNNFLVFEEWNVEVFKNGILQVYPTNISFENRRSRIDFTNPLSEGDVIEVYADIYHILAEDDDGEGSTINLESSDQRIRSVLISNKGAGYNILPKCSPGGYIYLDSVTGFTANENVTNTGGATATIVKVDAQNNRLIVKRDSTHTGSFAVDEVITGGTSESTGTISQLKMPSGTGAKLIAYSDEIGKVGSINISETGSGFTEDALIAGTSTHPMLITNLSASIDVQDSVTGDFSDATGIVSSYDSDRQLLKLIQVDGEFIEGETVTFDSTQSFEILKYNDLKARGKMSGEAIIGKRTTSDYGNLDSSEQNIHDNRFYQSHSYVVRVGESINRWRSALKDLLHPTGHIFFGEVSIKSNVTAGVEDMVSFQPTVIIEASLVPQVINAFANSQRTVKIHEEVDMQIAYLDAGVPSSGTDLSRGDRQRHMNIFKIVSKVESSTLVGTRTDQGTSTATSLSLESANEDYFVIDNERRPAREGKVKQVATLHDEILILEDGGKIEREEILGHLRLEPKAGEEYVVDFGARIILEDDDILQLEDATTGEETQYFITERSISLMDNAYIYFEDNNRIIFEDNTAMVDEEASEVDNYSFVNIGPTFASLNTISEQQTYDIAYYIKDETDGDNITLEDGYGSIMSEESKSEGLRIIDLDEQLGNFFIPEFNTHFKERTNFTFSSYIKSA